MRIRLKGKDRTRLALQETPRLAWMTCATCLVFGCATITHTYPQESEILDLHEQHSVVADWTYEARWTQKLTPSGTVIVSGQLTKHRICEVRKTWTEVTTKRTVRYNTTPGKTIAAAIIGSAGVGALAWGIREYRHGEPFVQRQPDGSENPTAAGAAVFIGAGASLFLPAALYDMGASIDTSSSSEREDASAEREECDRQLAPKVSVALESGGKSLGEEVTDARGRVDFRIPLELADTVTNEVQVIVVGHALDATIASLEKMPEADFPLRPYMDGTFLAGVVIKGAERPDLTNALTTEGAVVSESGRNKDTFDLVGPQWLGARQLVVIYDDDGKFVLASFQGQFVGADYVQLMRLMTNKWGKPTLQRESNEPIRYAWNLGEGIQAVFTLGRGSGTDLSREVGVQLSLTDVEAKARLRRKLEQAQEAQP